MQNDTTTPTVDVGSMNAGKASLKDATRPSKHRDGFHLISNQPAKYDIDYTDRYHFTDITYKVSTSDHIGRIAFNRPHVLHAFRPKTINEIRKALEYASDDTQVGVILLTSEIYNATTDATTKPYTNAFCSGGDQTVRGEGGYDDGSEEVPRLRVLDLQIQMRRCLKPIIAVVYGYAIGGGHILHMCCDLTLASEDAVFGQTGPRMGSFDSGYGSTHMARLIGQKKAREFWFLCNMYSAQEALDMGLVNAVYPSKDLEGEVARWCRRIIMNSPTAIACCKASLNADEDGAAGIALLAGQTTRLFYLSEESKEGKRAFLEKRAPQFRNLPSSRL